MAILPNLNLARLRRVVGDRREARRQSAIMRAYLTVGAMADWPERASLNGRTLDISERGLSFFVIEVRCEELSRLVSKGMTVVVALPTQTITSKVVVVGVRKHMEDGQRGCVLGVEITDMEEAGRELLCKYLDSL
ncbi:MAG: PilZ domain-containing protein [Rubrivivax sp.]|nr:PilZ domain-containing protein [Pyrinomonadaceae bacterium]